MSSAAGGRIVCICVCLSAPWLEGGVWYRHVLFDIGDEESSDTCYCRVIC